MRREGTQFGVKFFYENAKPLPEAKGDDTYALFMSWNTAIMSRYQRITKLKEGDPYSFP